MAKTVERITVSVAALRRQLRANLCYAEVLILYSRVVGQDPNAVAMLRFAVRAGRAQLALEKRQAKPRTASAERAIRLHRIRLEPQPRLIQAR